MAAALKQFQQETGTTPVSGTIQDMTSTPEFYLDLQRVYLAKSEADRKQMATYATQILTDRGISDPQAWLDAHSDEFKVFCKNANNLEVTRVRSLADDLKELKVDEDFQWSLHDEEECHLWYILTRCIEEFRDEFGYYAGMVDHNSDSPAEDKARAHKEFTWIKERADAYVAKITPDQKFNEAYLHELIRFSDSKLHTVSAFLGGIASQEIIKILIR